MAFTTNNPLIRNGVTYDKLAVNLAVAPGFTESGIAARVVLTCTPYHEAEDGTLTVADAQSDLRMLVIGDAFAASAADADLAQAMGTIMGALQAFIAAKGL